MMHDVILVLEKLFVLGERQNKWENWYVNKNISRTLVDKCIINYLHWQIVSFMVNQDISKLSVNCD